MRFIRVIESPVTPHTEMHVSLTELRLTSHGLAPRDSPDVPSAHWTRLHDGLVHIEVETAGYTGLTSVVEFPALRTVGLPAVLTVTLHNSLLYHVQVLAVRCGTNTNCGLQYHQTLVHQLHQSVFPGDVHIVLVLLFIYQASDHWVRDD